MLILSQYQVHTSEGSIWINSTVNLELDHFYGATISYAKDHTVHYTGMIFFRRSADFRLFWTKTIISENDANPLRSQNAYIGGGDTEIVSEYGGGDHIRGQFSAFFYQHLLSSLIICDFLIQSQNYKLLLALSMQLHNCQLYCS